MDKATAITAAVLLMSPAGVLALVKWLGSLGLSGYWKLAAAPVIGIALNLAAFYSGIAYVGAPIFAVIAAGVIVGLTASGIWDATAKAPVNVTVTSPARAAAGAIFDVAKK
jgi:hypothetical protein